MADIACSSIIVYLCDNVLRRVSKIEKVIELWAKLEELYMPKTLTNKMYLKERLFGYKMDPSKSLEENLDDFSIICIELANSGEEVKDKHRNSHPNKGTNAQLKQHSSHNKGRGRHHNKNQEAGKAVDNNNNKCNYCHKRPF